MPKYVPDGEKQKPDVLPDNAYDRTKLTPSQSFCKIPNSVIFSGVTNNVGFFFGSSASFASKATSEGPETNQLSGSQHYTSFGKPADGTSINISPTAWSGSAADDNSVIFVYKSGLSGGGV